MRGAKPFETVARWAPIRSARVSLQALRQRASSGGPLSGFGIGGQPGYTLRAGAILLVVAVTLLRNYRPPAVAALLFVLIAAAFLLPIVLGSRAYAAALAFAAVGANLAAPHTNAGAAIDFVIIGLAGARLPLVLSLPVAGLTAALVAGGALSVGALGQVWSQLSWLVATFALALTVRLRRVAQVRQTATLAELARSNAELRAAHEQLRLDSERAVALAAADERERIAREIHDVLAHTLTILVVQVGAVKRLVERDPVRAQRQLDLIAQLTREGLAEVRRSVHALHTADEEGVVALEKLTRDFAERADVAATFAVGSDLPPLPPALSKALYRVTQEALTNAVRHGNARAITARLELDRDRIVLAVRDDGMGGAASPPVSGGGNGLRGAAERVRAFGGDVAAHPLVGGGFLVEAKIPLTAAYGSADRQAPGNDLAAAAEQGTGAAQYKESE